MIAAISNAEVRDAITDGFPQEAKFARHDFR